MEKSVKISMLLEFYRSLLTEKQVEICDLYYNQNLSLSEIGEEFEISRQAVRKSLVEAEKNLFLYEEKLQLWQKQKIRDEKIEKLLAMVEDEKVARLIEELR